MKAVQLLVSTVILTITSFSAVADYSLDPNGVINVGDAQDIVITYSGDLQAEALLHGGRKTHKGYDNDYDDDDTGFGKVAKRHKRLDLPALEENVEQACLALTLGQFLKAGNYDPNTPANVTLFVRNDGVALANREVVQVISGLQNKGKVSKCQTTAGAFSLQENLEAFIAGDDKNLVNCPLCWCPRFAPGVDFPTCIGSYDGYGVLDPNAIPPLFLGAEKVIDF